MTDNINEMELERKKFLEEFVKIKFMIQKGKNSSQAVDKKGFIDSIIRIFRR